VRSPHTRASFAVAAHFVSTHPFVLECFTSTPTRQQLRWRIADIERQYAIACLFPSSRNFLLRRLFSSN
jgi:hypothetical protein